MIVAIVRELVVYSYVHPNLMHARGFYTLDSESLSILMPAAPMTLASLAKHLIDPIRLLQHIGSALLYLASQSIHHNDVRPSNIVCTPIDGRSILECKPEHIVYVLIDYTNVHSHPTEHLTLPDYYAPELFKTKQPSLQTDLWSLAKTYFDVTRSMDPSDMIMKSYNVRTDQSENYASVATKCLETFLSTTDLKPNESQFANILRENFDGIVDLLQPEEPSYNYKISNTLEYTPVEVLNSWTHDGRKVREPEVLIDIGSIPATAFRQVTPLLQMLISSIKDVTPLEACEIVRLLIKMSALRVVHLLTEDTSTTSKALYKGLLDINLDVLALRRCEECLL